MTKQAKMIITGVVLILIALAALLYAQSRKKEEFGGFQEGSEQYYGYRYAQDHLKSVDQCDDDKDDPEMKINKVFIEGCESFFKKALK